MEYGLEKKIAAWAHANRELNKQEDWILFCMKRLRTLKSFKIFKSEIKKLKTYSGWCAFKGLSNDTTLMQIQSGQTVPLKALHAIHRFCMQSDQKGDRLPMQQHQKLFELF